MTTIGRVDARGFSLIEALVALAIGTLIIAGLTTFHASQDRSLREHRDRLATAEGARVTLAQIVLDLRTSGWALEPVTGAGLTYAGADEIRFSLDANGDGVIDSSDPAESKGFRRNGASVEVWIPPGGVTSWMTLATFGSIAAPLFRYYRADGTEITALPVVTVSLLETIRRVDVRLAVTDVGSGSRSFRRAAVVELRNRSS